MAEEDGSGSPTDEQLVTHRYSMDQISIASHMDANREALQKKLLYRRSVEELKDQGIYPSTKSPAQFAGQGIRLQRAQTGDKLNKKIQSRPDRQFLVSHHILEDSKVDPSLQEKQRQLRKAQLSDELNEKIAHRPGPLELVKHNILEAKDPLKQAINDGTIEFKTTDEGLDSTLIPKVPYEVESPEHSSPEPTDNDNDSNSSSQNSTGFSHIPSPPDIQPLLTKQAPRITIGGKTRPITTIAQTFIPAPTLTLPGANLNYSTAGLSAQTPSCFGATKHHTFRTKRNNKNKPLSSKQRVIKFHEYKGPSRKPSQTSSTTTAGGQFVTTTGPEQQFDDLTPYQLRLQQQQLYLQCQLEIQTAAQQHNIANSHAQTLYVQGPPSVSPSEWEESLHKSPLSVAPPSVSSISGPSSVPPLSSPRTPASVFNHCPPSISSQRSLEDMKVSDLRNELKARNLPISGPKPQLIERLRSCISESRDKTPPNSPLDDVFKSPPPSVASSVKTSVSDADEQLGTSTTAYIVREQQKQIEELQRALLISQQRWQMASQQPAPVPNTQRTPLILPNTPIRTKPQQDSNQPVDITDKQVYLATPDGRMTAIQVVLHTGNGFTQPIMKTSTQNTIQIQTAPQTGHSVLVQPQTQTTQNIIHSQTSINTHTSDTRENTNHTQTNGDDCSTSDHNDNSETQTQQTPNIEEVLEALINTGEIDCRSLSSRIQNSHHNIPQNFPNNNIREPNKLHPPAEVENMDEFSQPPLSPLPGMEWMETESSNQMFTDSMQSDGHNFVNEASMLIQTSEASRLHISDNFDWLSSISDELQLDQNHGPSQGMIAADARAQNSASSSDPLLNSKPMDTLNIFNMEEHNQFNIMNMN